MLRLFYFSFNSSYKLTGKSSFTSTVFFVGGGKKRVERPRKELLQQC